MPLDVPRAANLATRLSTQALELRLRGNKQRAIGVEPRANHLGDAVISLCKVIDPGIKINNDTVILDSTRLPLLGSLYMHSTFII